MKVILNNTEFIIEKMVSYTVIYLPYPETEFLTYDCVDFTDQRMSPIFKIARKFSFKMIVNGEKKNYIFEDYDICVKERKLIKTFCLSNDFYFDKSTRRILKDCRIIKSSKKDKKINEFVRFVLANFEPKSIINNNEILPSSRADFWKNVLDIHVEANYCETFEVHYCYGENSFDIRILSTDFSREKYFDDAMVDCTQMAAEIYSIIDIQDVYYELFSLHGEAQYKTADLFFDLEYNLLDIRIKRVIEYKRLFFGLDNE